jgi:hypothetical protein
LAARDARNEWNESRDGTRPKLAWESKWIANERTRRIARGSSGITFHRYPIAAIGSASGALKAISRNCEAGHTTGNNAIYVTCIRVTLAINQ